MPKKSVERPQKWSLNVGIEDLGHNSNHAVVLWGGEYSVALATLCSQFLTLCLLQDNTTVKVLALSRHRGNTACFWRHFGWSFFITTAMLLGEVVIKNLISSASPVFMIIKFAPSEKLWCTLLANYSSPVRNSPHCPQWMRHSTWWHLGDPVAEIKVVKYHNPDLTSLGLVSPTNSILCQFGLK